MERGEVGGKVRGEVELRVGRGRDCGGGGERWEGRGGVVCMLLRGAV